MNYNLDKMKTALADIEELLADVKAGYFIPKRFRKMPTQQFMEVERPKYIRYLEREASNLAFRIRQTEKRLAV